MNFLILSEGGKDLGFGHIARCLPIFKELLRANQNVTLLINGDASVSKFVDDYNVKIVCWNNLKQIKIILDSHYDIVILDSLTIKNEVYDELIESKIKLAVIDDLQLRDYNNGEIIIDWFVDAEKNNFYRGKDCLLGSKYVTLREKFQKVPTKTINIELHEIIITLGGTDFRNMSPQIIKMLKHNYFEIKTHLFVAEGFKNIKNIKKCKYPNLVIHYNPSDDEIIETCLKADIAIATGGHTINELAVIGVPTIHFLVVENQRKAENWKYTGFTEFVGWWDDKMLLNNMCDTIEKLKDRKKREEMSQAGKKMVDGKGTKRLVNELLKRLK